MVAGMSLEAAQERHRVAGRNDACPCGSGKKYKKCHQAEDDTAISAELHRLDAEILAKAAAEAAEAEAEEAADGEGKTTAARAKAAARSTTSGGVGQRQGTSARAQNLPRRRAV
jgi:septal ring factor EnvC (AmiA/AmiB activator)